MTTGISGKNYTINVTKTTEKLNVSTALSGLSAADSVWINTDGGNDVITGGGTAAQVTAAYGLLAAANQLSWKSAANGGVDIMDGSKIDFVVTPGANGVFTVTSGTGAKLGSVSGISNLNFYVDSGANPTTNALSLQLQTAIGDNGGNAQGGQNYAISGNDFGVALNVNALLPGLKPADNVYIQNNGGAGVISAGGSLASVTAGYQVASAANPLTTKVLSNGSIEVLDGSQVDFLITPSGSGFKVSAGGVSLGSVSGAGDLHFQVASASGPSTNFVDLKGLIQSSEGGTDPQGGNYYSIYGSSFPSAINVKTLLAGLTAADSVFVWGNGIADNVSGGGTAAQVTVGYTIASASNALTAKHGSNGAIDIMDGSQVDFVITPAGSGFNVSSNGVSLGSVTGVNDLQFDASNSATGGAGNVITISAALLENSNGTNAQGGQNYTINGTLFAQTINVAKLLPKLGAADTVYIQNGGGADSVTGGGSAANVTVGYQIASAANQLTVQQAANGAWDVMDGSKIDFVVTDKNNIFSVSANGQSLGTITSANDLHFQLAPAAGAAVSNQADLYIAITSSQNGPDPQGGNFYSIGGTMFNDTLSVNALLPGLKATDDVYVAGNGGADSVTGSGSAANVTVGYQIASASHSLTTKVISPTSFDVMDGSIVDFTVTDNKGVFTIASPSGGSLGTATSVATLQFQQSAAGGAQPSNIDDVPVGITTLQTGSNQAGGNNYTINGTIFAETINVATLLPGLSAADSVYIQNKGAIDNVVAGGSAASLVVGYQLGSTANPLTIHNDAAGKIDVMDGSQIDYILSLNADGSVAIANGSGASLGSVSGVTYLNFNVAGNQGNSLTVPVGLSTSEGGLDPQGGHYYGVNSAAFAETINVAKLLPQLSAADSVYVDGDGANDVITGGGTAAFVTAGYHINSANNPLTTKILSATSFAVMDGSQLDFTVTDNAGTLSISNEAGAVIGTANLVDSLEFQVAPSGSGSTSNVDYVPVAVTALENGANQSGGNQYTITATAFADSINVGALLPGLGAADSVFVQNEGGVDSVTGGGALANITVGYQLASAVNPLTLQYNANGTIDVMDGSQIDFVLAANGTGGVTVTTGANGSLGSVSGVTGLDFAANGGNNVYVQVGITTSEGGPDAAGGHNYSVNGTFFASSTNINSLLPALTAADTVFVNGIGGSDAITGGGTAASVTVGYQIASASNSLTTKILSATSFAVMDGSVTDFQVSDHAGLFTVTDGAGNSLGSASNVTALQFQLQPVSGTNATNVDFVPVAITIAQNGENAQGGANDAINATVFANVIDIASLLPKAAAADSVYVANQGAADQVVGTGSPAAITVGYQVASASHPLTILQVSPNVTDVMDGSQVDFVVTDNQGVETITTGSGIALGSATVVSDLHFQVTPPANSAPTNQIDLTTAALDATAQAGSNAANAAIVTLPANATFTSNGAKDIFAFGSVIGQTTITDFNPAIDALQFSHVLFANAAAALAASAVSGNNLQISIDANDTITLLGVTALNAANVNIV